jgi:hypothetical protein
MICVALQDYGMIMVDGTINKKVLLMMESKTTASWQSIVGRALGELRLHHPRQGNAEPAG